MSIRILGGLGKGHVLEVPPENITRPTSVMLRRKLFDRYQDISDYTFIDICAGSGAMGLEAISRGAKKVIFIENSQKALSILKKNIKSFKEKLQLKDDIFQVLFTDYKKLNFSQVLDTPSFIFFDPPYEKKQLYQEFFDLLSNQSLIDVIVVVEACSQKTMTITEFEQKFGTPDKVLTHSSHYFALYEF